VTDPHVYRISGNARISRLTISLAGLHRPGAIATGYGGVGIGFYRLTQDKVKGPIRAGVSAHGGGELPVSNTVTLNAEIGVHIVGENFVRTNGVLLGEAVIRLKIGL
jgi:hypothetical protein